MSVISSPMYSAITYLVGNTMIMKVHTNQITELIIEAVYKILSLMQQKRKKGYCPSSVAKYIIVPIILTNTIITIT